MTIKVKKDKKKMEFAMSFEADNTNTFKVAIVRYSLNSKVY